MSDWGWSHLWHLRTDMAKKLLSAFMSETCAQSKIVKFLFLENESIGRHACLKPRSRNGNSVTKSVIKFNFIFCFKFKLN